MRSAHGAEVGALGSVLGEGFVVVFAGGDGVERQIELVFPAELESCFGEGVVAVLGAGVAFGEVGGVGGEFVGDDADFDVFFVGQTEVLLGRDVAEHGAAVPADHGGTNAGGDVVVAGGDIGGEGPEGVEGGFVAPFELLGHVFLDHVHGDVAGAFVHDLDAFGPSAFGELALDFEFAELGFVVGIGDGAGAEAVANGEGDVVGGHDVADVIPMGVEEAFFVVGEAPFGHDGAAAADDAGHAGGRHGDEAEEDAGVDGEVIDALLGLFDEGIAEEFPGEVFGFAVHFFQGLIDGHGADGHGGVPQDPFARGVDVFAGGEVHHGIAAPLGGPAHFFDLFLDGGSDGAVADVGIDFDEEVAPDDHGLKLGVIDVGRDDGAACGDLRADELGGDLIRDALGEAFEDAGGVFVLDLGGASVLLVQVIADDVAFEIGDLGAAHVFADGNEFHLGRDDAFFGISKLGDHFAGLGLQGLALGIDGGLQRAEQTFTLGGGVFGVVFGEVAIVTRLDSAAFVGFHVTTTFDPRAAQGREARFHGALVIWVTPGAGGVINTDGSVFFDLAVETLRGAELDLTHGHLHIGVNLTLDIDAGRGGELLAGMWFEGVFGGDHEGRVGSLGLLR